MCATILYITKIYKYNHIHTHFLPESQSSNIYQHNTGQQPATTALQGFLTVFHLRTCSSEGVLANDSDGRAGRVWPCLLYEQSLCWSSLFTWLRLSQTFTVVSTFTYTIILLSLSFLRCQNISCPENIPTPVPLSFTGTSPNNSLSLLTPSWYHLPEGPKLTAEKMETINE